MDDLAEVLEQHLIRRLDDRARASWPLALGDVPRMPS
jgi:hypothetical protein